MQLPRSFRASVPYIVSGAAQVLLIGGLAGWSVSDSSWEISLEQGRSSELSVALAAAQPEEPLQELEVEEFEIAFELPLDMPLPTVEEVPIVEAAPEPLPIAQPEPAKEPLVVERPRPPLAKQRPEPVAKEKPKPPAAQQTPSAASSPAESGAVVDAPARRLPTNASPQYPLEARAAEVQGRVVLRVSIAADGSVERVTVHTSSGSESLDRAALAAVEAWRFVPATRDGVPTASEVLVPVRFSIRR